MGPTVIPESLLKARRAFDSVNEMSILQDWMWNEDLKVWYLKLRVNLDISCSFLPSDSNWYIITTSQYPKGKIKIYPDVENSLTATLQHQAINAKIEKNGLWRRGSLCLETSTSGLERNSSDTEPQNENDRLIWHVIRAVDWIKAAITNTLVCDGDPFELPQFDLNIRDSSCEIFAFSEDVVTFMQWEDVEERYGIVELDGYKSGTFVSLAKCFKNIGGEIVHSTAWGTYLSKTRMEPPIKAIWVLLNEVPVINVWQAPISFGELIQACLNQSVDLIGILRTLSSKLRDGKRHLFLIGFPIPEKVGQENEIIYWQALRLPALSNGTKTINGFRPNEKGWWQRDRQKVLVDSLELNWIESQNWNQYEISNRGKLTSEILRKSILVLGGGCIGSSTAELLIRAGVCSMTIMDYDLLEIGNLSRHTLLLDDIGEFKGQSLAQRLNKINPHARVKVIQKKFAVEESSNFDINKFDIIIDCTGSDQVLKDLSNFDINKKTILISIAIGLGAKHLFVTMFNSTKYNFASFYGLINKYIKKEKESYDWTNIPRNGIGCWHPVFPARSDDIWLAASTSIKIIESYVESKNDKNLSLVFCQDYSDGLFNGYKLLERLENG